MASKINIDKLANELLKELETYRNVTVELMEGVVKETAKETVRKLKNTSPKDSGEYAKSWRSKRDNTLKGKWAFSMVVYNKGHYQLTHLLEHGHAKVGGGRVAGIEHIEPAERLAERVLEETLIDKLAEGN